MDHSLVASRWRSILFFHVLIVFSLLNQLVKLSVIFFLPLLYCRAMWLIIDKLRRVYICSAHSHDLGLSTFPFIRFRFFVRACSVWPEIGCYFFYVLIFLSGRLIRYFMMDRLPVTRDKS